MKMFVGFWEILWEYIQNNNLNVDKTIYFTIVIGQITIFGILLAFYQFVASYQNNEANLKYLGYNLAEYYVRKKVGIIGKIISNKWFEALFIIEIFYKPIMVIYGKFLPMYVNSRLNFLWFLFAILYFCSFVILFVKCLHSMSWIKSFTDIKKNKELLRDVNETFLKKKKRSTKKQLDIELLQMDFRRLKIAIEDDGITDGPLDRYDELISDMFMDYLVRKEKLFNYSKKGKALKNQDSWKRIERLELQLFKEIIEEKYFRLSDKNKRNIFGFHLKCVYLNLKRAGSDYQIRYRLTDIPYDKNVDIYDVHGWIDVTQKLYLMMPDEEKGIAVKELWNKPDSECKNFDVYCNECIKLLIEREIEEIFAGERKSEDVRKIFEPIVQEKEINDLCAQKILDMLVENNNFDASEMVEWLNQANCAYLFTYIIVYYSVYKFRFEWKFINLKVLTALWKQPGSLQNFSGIVADKIKSSWIKHRYTDEMQKKLMEYIDAGSGWELFIKIKTDSMIDVFYMWVIKTCVTNPNGIYSWDEDTFDEEVLADIINGLAKHEELMENPDVTRWINHIKRIAINKKTKSIPQNLEITFRSLLLLPFEPFMISDCVLNFCYHYDAVGAYLLCKMDELPPEKQQDERVKSAVKKAFVLSNMDVAEYLNMIQRECDICKCRIYDGKKLEACLMNCLA